MYETCRTETLEKNLQNVEKKGLSLEKKLLYIFSM